MNYIVAQTLSPESFKRRFGIHQTTLKQMVKALRPQWRPAPKPGAKPKLELEDRVLVALEYWREYRTYFHIGSRWGISESSVCRIVHWVEAHLMRSGRFRLPGKKHWVQGFGRPTVAVVEVTRGLLHHVRFFDQSLLIIFEASCSFAHYSKASVISTKVASSFRQLRPSTCKRYSTLSINRFRISQP